MELKCCPNKTRKFVVVVPFTVSWSCDNGEATPKSVTVERAVQAWFESHCAHQCMKMRVKLEEQFFNL